MHEMPGGCLPGGGVVPDPEWEDPRAEKPEPAGREQPSDHGVLPPHLRLLQALLKVHQENCNLNYVNP